MGTAAHMWTMAHASEEEAFAGYVAVFPNAAILLIDTYDTLRGAERAARIARDKLKGVRLDSGDLFSLSRAVRRILDENGCKSAQIVASGYRIAEIAVLWRVSTVCDMRASASSLPIDSVPSVRTSERSGANCWPCRAGASVRIVAAGASIETPARVRQRPSRAAANRSRACCAVTPRR